MKQRLLFLTAFYTKTILLFAMAKLVFMCCYAAGQPFSLADVCSVLLHGLSLDLSTALYLLIVPFLVSLASVWLPVPRWLLKGYYGIVAIALSLAFVADTSLYAFWHFKLDASCLQYLETPTEAMASVSAGYLLLRLVLFAVVAVAIYFCYSCGALSAEPMEGRGVSHTPMEGRGVSHTPKHWRAGLLETLLYLLLIPLIVVGIRGGLDESTTNIGQVYFSSRQFLNHAAVNPVFSFLSSLGKSGDYIVDYHFMDDDECRRLTNGLYTPCSLPSDTLLRTPRPNIVLIVMEGCGAQFTDVGGHPDITPRLNSLRREGIDFTECYANSWRTDKGLVSILSGYPAFPITSLMKVPEKSRKLPAIARSLSREGYACSFFYGGDINFTNMRSYVMSSGYDRLTWKADYPRAAQQSSQWGVSDSLMFASLLSDIRQEHSRPWMKTLLTLSSHEPWDVPTHRLSDKVYNAFNYLDACLGQFIDSLRHTPQWQDLLVVILPDHGYRYQGIDETTRLYNHIPMLWVGGAVKAPRSVTAVCSQSDLAATLLGQLAIAHHDYRFSRDVLSADYRKPFAFHTFVDGLTLIDSAGFAAYDLESQHMIATEGPAADSLLQQGKALLQLFSDDLKKK